MRSLYAILFVALPASASNVVGTFGLTDTTGAVSSKSGTMTVDARVTPTPDGIASGVSVLGGLTDDVELGLGGVVGLAWAGGPALGTVAPWIRGRVLVRGETTLGLLAGSTVDLGTPSRSQVGSELLLTQGLGWGTLDVNLGGSVLFGGPSAMAHLSACLSVTLPRSLLFMAEVFGYVGALGPSVGQRVGLAWSPSRLMAFDLSMAVVESPTAAPQLSYLPQIGTAFFF